VFNIKHVTAMTFNLRMDTEEDGDNAWPYRKNAVIQMIQNHQPTVLGTQEGLHHMVEFLSSSLTDYAQIGEGREGGQNGEYSALFYKKDQLNLIDQGQFWLSETSDIPNSVSWKSACPRICTWGKFTFVDNPNEKIAVLNTHLDHISQLAREKGMDLIGSHIDAFIKQDIPVVLMGDFNCEPNNAAIQSIQELGLQVLPQESGRTFHGFHGGTEGEPIDYICASKEFTQSTTVINRQTFEQKYPSDHYPVVSQLVFTL